MEKDVVLASLITPEESDFPFASFEQVKSSGPAVQTQENESLIPLELDQKFNQESPFHEVIILESVSKLNLFMKKSLPRPKMDVILKDHSYCLQAKKN